MKLPISLMKLNSLVVLWLLNIMCLDQHRSGFKYLFCGQPTINHSMIKSPKDIAVRTIELKEQFVINVVIQGFYFYFYFYLYAFLQ